MGISRIAESMTFVHKRSQRCKKKKNLRSESNKAGSDGGDVCQRCGMVSGGTLGLGTRFQVGCSAGLWDSGSIGS
jgi:hypothetical protein